MPDHTLAGVGIPLHPVVRLEVSIPEQDLIGGQVIAFWFVALGNQGVKFGFAGGKVIIVAAGKQKLPGSKAQVLCNYAPCRTRRIAVFIVEPAQHLFLNRFFAAELDAVHELITEIGCLQPSPGMDVKPAKTHLFEDINLLQQHLRIQSGVPCPKRCSPILTGWFAKECRIQLLCLIPVV